MNHVVVGLGEVGRALAKVLAIGNAGHVVGVDININPDMPVNPDMMHICFPWSTAFKNDVAAYRERYHPKWMVIHSTVPVGTSRELKAVHSPVRGPHWSMERALMTFVKFVGGEKADASIVANEFLRCGMRPHMMSSSEATELGKIMDTTLYGVLIAFHRDLDQYCRDLDQYCRDHGLSFTEVSTQWTETYNDGYAALAIVSDRTPSWTNGPRS